jgi:hypothetical protein
MGRFPGVDPGAMYRFVRRRIFSLPDPCLPHLAVDTRLRVTRVGEERRFNPRLGGEIGLISSSNSIFSGNSSPATGNLESSVIRSRYAPRRGCVSCPTEGWAASYILHRRGALAVLLFHRESECRDLSTERENDGV